MTTAIKIRKGDTVVEGRAWDLENCAVKALGNPSDNRFLVVASFDAEDRDSDTIEQRGWVLDYFDAHPVLVDSHDYDTIEHQIGEFNDRDIKQSSLQGVAEYYAGQGNQTADWAAFLARKGRAAFSVGFIPLESTPRKNGGGLHYSKQELLELSQVIVPSSRQALQLMAKGVTAQRDSLQAKLARELLSDFETEQKRPKVWRGATLPRQKWDSAYMDDDAADPYGYSSRELRCIVPGCDDASQTSVCICSEHLKVLMNAEPEPAGSPPDDLDSVMRGLTRRFRFKAGRQISGANLGHLHTALQSLHTVHDANCTADDCPLDDGADDPVTERDKQAKAASEGSGSAGGVTVSDSGTHGAFTGSHTHEHADPSGDPGDTHKHVHSHDGDGDHGHSHAKAAPEPETKAATNGLDPQALSNNLERELSAVLEGITW